MRQFGSVCLDLILRPRRGMTALERVPAPTGGLIAVLVRFVATSATSILALLLLGREPFTESSLAFLPTRGYYLAEVFFLPVYGVTAWLLMAGMAHLVIRLSRAPGSMDRTLNIIGFGMLAPMLVLWPVDWLMIATSTYALPQVAITHALAQIWEAAIEAIGFHRVLGIGAWLAVALALAINVTYVLLAMIFVR